MSTKKPNILYQYIDKFKTSYHTYLEIVGSFLWIPVPCEIYNKKIDGLILKCLRVQSEHANHWIIQSIKTIKARFTFLQTVWISGQTLGRDCKEGWVGSAATWPFSWRFPLHLFLPSMIWIASWHLYHIHWEECMFACL